MTIEWIRSGRPNLLVISRGPRGIRTLAGPDRNWDWVEFHWKPEATVSFREGAHSSSKPDLVIDEPDPVCRQSKAIAKHAEAIGLARYDRVAQVGDDVRCNGTWSRAFDLLAFWQRARGVQIAQCAHANDSAWDHEFARAVRLPCLARDVTHVDDVAPLFTREALRRMLPYFRDNTVYDASLDRIWSNLGLPMMIFDTVTMTHTAPCADGDPSRLGGRRGLDWMQELQRQYPGLPPLGASRATGAWFEGPGEDQVYDPGSTYGNGILHREPLALRRAEGT